MANRGFCQHSLAMQILTLVGKFPAETKRKNILRNSPVVRGQVIKHSIEICEIDLILFQSVVILDR